MKLEDLRLKITDHEGKLLRRFHNTKFIQKYLKPEEIAFIKELYPDCKAIERFWLVEHNFLCKPSCEGCGEKLKFISYKEGYQLCPCGHTVQVASQWEAPEWIEGQENSPIGGELMGEIKLAKFSAHPAQRKPEKQKKITKKAYPYVKDGIPFNNAWDLAFWVFCKETNLPIERNTTKFFKFFDKNNKVHKYFPAFIFNGQYTEICNDEPFKGQENFWGYKEAIIKENNINIISKEDMKKVLIYIRKKYGKKYLKQFRRRTDRDIKRKIIDILEEEDIDKLLYEKRNSTAKAKFVCRRCDCVAFQSARTLLHFGTLYCNTCRRRLKKEGKPYKKEKTN